ncbi:biopolymer transporter ExbD [Vreelandella utahensis]|uniref:biopolymer transporter ExbD n=1 Tax=Vreelandella halophila TaxID=86177 RepID=UPI0009866F23|nr:biopolymer transporter ExbD [Halomonas utahensis]
MKQQQTFFPESDNDPSLTEKLEEGLLPLINVVFLLLLFFLIAGIVLQDQLPALPDTANGRDERRPDMDLVVEADGNLRFDGSPIERNALGEKLPEYNESDRLRLGVDEQLSMSELESLFQTLDEAGHPQVILLTDPGQ